MSDTYMFTANPSCINAQGVWRRIGDASFVGTHKAFCFDANNGFQPDGWQIWRYAVTLSADGNSLLGRSRLDLYDANGNPAVLKAFGSARHANGRARAAVVTEGVLRQPLGFLA